ncbi:MAG: MFS transporter [Alphaproteobacteria bacterium]
MDQAQGEETGDAKTGGGRGPVDPTIPSTGTKLAYGLGSISSGVKSGGFDYFLLIFYAQVVGLDPRLVGLALTIALVFDAITDPLVGYWSDNLHSRLGRRHPFMYVAALPVSVTYFLLWTPPADWSQAGQFWYLLTLAVLIRTFMTLFETPSFALAPELTDDYDERSRLIGYRYFFGWIGGNTMTVMMFFFVFPAFATVAVPDGRFNMDSYVFYGLVAGVMIFVSIMIASVGTHNRIRHLKPAPPKRPMGVRVAFQEIFETLSDRSFAALFGASLFGAIATGLSGGLAFYIVTYFWGFDSLQVGAITLSVFLSALIGLILAPRVTRGMGKKRGAIIIGLIAFLGSPLPIVLRLFDLMPDNGTALLFWIVFVTTTVDVGLIICFQILAASMIADLVEQSELRTTRRSEGIFFAAITFVRKSVQGLGVTAAAFVLWIAAFPTGAAPGEVSGEALWRLGATYAPAVVTIWMLMMVCITQYRLDRAGHEDNLRRLSESRGRQISP